MPEEPTVMIVAGEASGDHHAARLVEEARRLRPELRFFGIGGEEMRQAGVDTWVDSREMAVVGLFEVLAHFPTIYGALRRLRRGLHEHRPDLLILVDYPDFNLRLAKTAKRLGVPVLYYISPQIWAWRSERVHMIRRRVDKMAVVFPFEVPFYERAGVPVRFVGHPLVERVESPLSRAEALRSFGLDPARPCLGLFPGSRRSEIKRLLPLLLNAAADLRRRHPELQLLLPRASTLDAELLQPAIDASGLNITVVANRPHDVMRACDTVITASGTVTLELALLEVPMVVVYRINPFSYHIMRRMIRVDHIALCNIVAGERVVPELIQEAATPRLVAATAERLLEDGPVRRTMQRRLARIGERLGEGGGSEKVARLALEMLAQSHRPGSSISG